MDTKTPRPVQLKDLASRKAEADARIRPRAFSLLVILMLWPLMLTSEPYAKHTVPTGLVRDASTNEGVEVWQDQPVLSGAHTLQSAVTPIPFGPGGLRHPRFLDAHDTADKDFAVVTRFEQDNATQRWIFRNISGRFYIIQQQHTGRFLDAHDTSDKDFAVVTRPQQENTTQRWIVAHVAGNTYTIRQQSTGRFLEPIFHGDAAVVTRPRQTDSRQQWIIRPVSPGTAHP